jgi:hypothetical protein
VWGRSAVLAVTLVALASGCIVTDTIGFEDEVNHPPEVLLVEPLNEYISTVCQETQQFTLTVWDPDEADAASYAAKIYLRLNPTVTGGWDVIKDCDISKVATATGEVVATYESGIQMSVNCQLPLGLYTLGEGEDLLLVQVRVSDRGYSPSNEVSEGARVAEVNWVLELLPDEVCQEGDE